MAIGLALAFDEEAAEKLEFEVALAGLTGFELVDAPTFEGGGTTCGAAAAGLEEEEEAAAAAEEEEPAEPIRSRAKASRARRDGWRCTAAAAVVWLAVVVVAAGPVGSCESHGPPGGGISVSVSRGRQRVERTDLAGGSHAGIAVRVIEGFRTCESHRRVLLVLPLCSWRPNSGREERKVGVSVVVLIRAAAAEV